MVAELRLRIGARNVNCFVLCAIWFVMALDDYKDDTEFDSMLKLNSLVMVDSGCAASSCPPSHGEHFGTIKSPEVLLCAAGGQKVEHFGRRKVFYNLKSDLGKTTFSVKYEVAAVKDPIIALSALEDAGWALTVEGGHRWLVRGDDKVRVWRHRRVYWIDAEVASRAAVAAHMCPLEEID